MKLLKTLLFKTSNLSSDTTASSSGQNTPLKVNRTNESDKTPTTGGASMSSKRSMGALNITPVQVSVNPNGSASAMGRSMGALNTATLTPGVNMNTNAANMSSVSHKSIVTQSNVSVDTLASEKSCY